MSAISAIVVSYFTGPALVQCLAALGADESVGEIIIVDNGNDVGAVDAACKAAMIDARVFSGHGNVGFAAGCNIGAGAATCHLLLLINPDAVIEPGGAARLLADGRALTRPWLMGARLMGIDGREQRGSRRAALTPWRAIGEATQLYRLGLAPRFNFHNDPLPDDLAQMPTLSGACLFLHADDYRAVGGMDESYFLHVEDIDFCKRFADAGGAVWFNPHVVVTHVKGSSRASAQAVDAHKTRGLIRYFNTHFRRSWPAPARGVLSALLWTAFGAKAIGRFARGLVGQAR